MMLKEEIKISQSSRMNRGKIILIEGTDGSGKKTQSMSLVERLNSEEIPSERMSFPRYHTPTGRIISQCYLGKKRSPVEGDVAWFGDSDDVDPKIAALYYAADRFAAIPEMNEILDSGKQLVLDRYVESNMAHQGGKKTFREERDEIINFIHSLEYEHLRLSKPDISIFLYMPFEITSVLRKNRGEEPDGHEGNEGHLKRAEEAYLSLSETLGWERIDCAPDGTINSLKTPEDIHKRVYKISKDFLNRHGQIL